ncbi:2'-5' RNA ligase family protein [Mycobacterium sp. 050134]|uniref:2'-5' RNA ligase family protein n=1 Tax=Mycobacterium sp. 050134 TaxID=3096111 RepID=UPI002ED85750
MVHSIELLFDPGTEAAIRRIWDGLAAPGEPGDSIRTPPGRPHVTLAVADRIADDADALLRPLAARLPLPCIVGAPLLLGRSGAILARLLVPTAALLDLHARVHDACRAWLLPEPAPNSLPGRWTPHVTLARRVEGPALERALRVGGRPPEIVGSLAALRRWDGDAKVDYLI